MAIISKPFTFTAGATIIASEHNSNFDTIYSDYNGGIENVNIDANAAIAASKLNLSTIAQMVDFTGSVSFTTITDLGAVTTADINGGTIDDTDIGQTTPKTGAFTTLNVGTTNQGDILYDNGTSLVRLTPGTSGQFLQTTGAASNPQWASAESLSNVIFCWTGKDGTDNFLAATSDIDTSTALTRPMMANVNNTTNLELLASKWTKIEGVNTLTVYGRVWTSQAGIDATLDVDVGGQNGSATNANDVTPTWVNFTIDVSSLTNGTNYDLSVRTRQSSTQGGSRNYMSAIIIFGS